MSAGVIASHYTGSGGGAGSAYAAEVMADSPLAWYRLGEASGTTLVDSSGNGHNGSYGNSVTFGVAGLVAGDANTAVSTSAAAVGLVPTGAWMNTSNITVEALIKPSTSGQYRIIMDRDDDGTRFFEFRLTDSDKLHLLWWTPTAGFFSITGSTTIAAGSKYHVAASVDNAGGKIYVQGVLDGSLAQTGGMRTGARDLAIGAHGLLTGAFPWRGVMDEVAYYGSALSAARIAAHAAAA